MAGANHTSAGSARPLAWQETFTDRGDGSSDHTGWGAETGFGPWYMIEQLFGSDSYGWTVEYDMEKIGEADDPEIAKQIAQRDFERRISAAMLVPAQPSGLSVEAAAAIIDPVAFDPISLDDKHPGWECRREQAIETARKIVALAAQPPVAPSDLASLCKEMLSGDPMELKSDGPLMKALAQEIGGEYAEVGAKNRTIRRALEVVAKSDGSLSEGNANVGDRIGRTRRPAHPMDTISGGPIGPSDPHSSAGAVDAVRRLAQSHADGWNDQAAKNKDRRSHYGAISDQFQAIADALAEVGSGPQEALNPGLTKAMEIVGEMRMSEAGIFDEKHSGQRGEDRSNALYDAYVAIRSALSRPQHSTGEA